MNGAQVVEVGKAREAKVFLVGGSKPSRLVELNDSVVEGGLHRGEELRDVGLPCQILGVPLWECKAGRLEGLSKGDDPLAMRADSFRLLGDAQRELEKVPDVAGLLGVDVGRVVGPEYLVEVNSQALDDIEPLVWREIGYPWGEQDFSNNVGGVVRPIVKDGENFPELGGERSLEDSTGRSPREEGFVDGGAMTLGRRPFILILI